MAENAIVDPGDLATESEVGAVAVHQPGSDPIVLIQLKLTCVRGGLGGELLEHVVCLPVENARRLTDSLETVLRELQDTS